MKNPAEAENLRNLNYAPFSDPLPGPIEPVNAVIETPIDAGSSERTGLDLLLSSVKWVFLFLPGTAVIHFIMMGFALLYFYNDWSFGLITASIGALIFGTFMTMLGMGKLGDLRYLRVAASLLAAGGLAAILYSLLTVFIPGDFFGLFARITLPLTVLVGYMVKRDTDKKFETD